MTILVAGASGYIGSHFITEFRDKASLVAVVRESAAAEPLGIAKISFADLATHVAPSAIPPGATLLHLVGSGRERTSGIYDSNVAVTERLIVACRSWRVKRVVFVSGYGVDQPSSSVYYRSKAEAERLIVDSGLEYQILRCSYVVGDGDELTPEILKSAATGTVTIPGDGMYRIQPVLLRDLLRILYRAARTEDLASGIWNVLGEAVEFRAFVKDIATTVNRHVEIRSRDMSLYVREAVTTARPEYSLSELGILVADKIGNASIQVLGVTLADYRAIVDYVVERL